MQLGFTSCDLLGQEQLPRAQHHGPGTQPNKAGRGRCSMVFLEFLKTKMGKFFFFFFFFLNQILLTVAGVGRLICF